MRLFPLLLLIPLCIPLSLPNRVQAQVRSRGSQQLAQSSTTIPSQTQPPSRTPHSTGGLDPFLILNLINSLSRSGGGEQTPRVDLSPELAEIRGNISRLYFLLARSYTMREQLPEACNALEKAHAAQLEGYLRKQLKTQRTDSNDCYASEMQRISQITGSRTALIYITTSAQGLELVVVPPSGRSPTGNGRLVTDKLAWFDRPVWGRDRTKSVTIPILAQAELSTPPFRKVAYNANTERINAVIQEFRANLRDASSYDFLPQAQQLYDWVIRPIEPDLERAKIQTLVFVMDGNLRVVPPAAFHDGKQYLVEKYAVTSVTSLQLTNTERRDRPLNNRVLAMGLSESVQGLTPLPATKVEVDTIASKVLPGTFFLDRMFTVDNLQAQRQRQYYDIVHLATHAKFSPQSANASYIQFWDDRVRLDRIPSLNLNVDILALSACETAVGNNLGIAGLSVDSGAKSVLASLWEVNDAGTAPLMISFYSKLQNAPSKAIALQKAQLSLLRKEVKIQKSKISGISGLPDIPLGEQLGDMNLTHPYFWSSFTLVGNWL